MNRNGWTYKKLGEVAEIISGSTPKTNIKEYWGGEHYWVTPAEIGSTIYIERTERTITEEAIHNSNLTLLPEGTVLLSSRAPIGKLAITKVPMYCNQGFKNIVCSEALNNKYVYYYIGNIVPYIQSLGRGATFKEVSKRIVENISIAFPSKEIQAQIVQELDSLNDSITMLQQQVKDLDSLAQSLFYDMFGDTVTNPKGFPLKKICEVGTVITGNTPSTKDSENYSSNDYCFVKPSDISKEGVADIQTSEFFISKKAYSNSRQLPKCSVLTTCIGIIGKVGILRKTATCNQQINAIVPNSDISSIYLAYAILGLRDVLEAMANAPVVPIINKGVFSMLQIPLPPLSLQHSFATKMASIEESKASLKAQITEMQNLLASRMQFWFD